MRTTKKFANVALGVILGSALTGSASAQEYGVPANGGQDLFYNYYTQGYANGANAAMYPSPVPVPPNVGWTYHTYQPLYPDEMLYWHQHRYHNYYDNGLGLNRTKALYYAPAWFAQEPTTCGARFNCRDRRFVLPIRSERAELIRKGQTQC